MKLLTKVQTGGCPADYSIDLVELLGYKGLPLKTESYAFDARSNTLQLTSVLGDVCCKAAIHSRSGHPASGRYLPIVDRLLVGMIWKRGTTQPISSLEVFMFLREFAPRALIKTKDIPNV